RLRTALGHLPPGSVGGAQESPLADAQRDLRGHRSRPRHRQYRCAVPGRSRLRALAGNAAGAALSDPMPKNWYVVHTYSGYEQKAKAALEERIRALGKQDQFGDVLVPAEKVVELVKGRKKTSSRMFFPGYILVNMELNDETWHIVKATPKVTGFV